MKIKQILEKIDIQVLNENNSESKKNCSFVFKGLPNELALTIGNYLRRILLSYIDGVAITGLKISNQEKILKSEFVPLNGVLETPPYIILNLKKLILKINDQLSSEESDEHQFDINIENKRDKEYIITGNDVKDKSGKLEVLNKDTYIATVSPNSTIYLKVWYRKSWGFSRENEKKNSTEEDLIAVDSNYNPVRNVSFKVDMVVVGLNKQEEQLTINIKTDGSVTPHQVLLNALKISDCLNCVLLDSLNNLSSNI